MIAMTCMGTSGEFGEPDISPGIYDDHTTASPLDCGWTEYVEWKSTDVSSCDMVDDMTSFSWLSPYRSTRVNGNRNGRWFTLNFLAKLVELGVYPLRTKGAGL